MKRLTVILLFILTAFMGSNVYADENQRQIPILTYHSVDRTGGMYSVTPEKLRSDIESLIREGYTTVTLGEVVDFVHSNAPLPDKCVVITFDDGYKNNYDTLLPIAAEMGFKFEMFGLAGFMEYSPLAMTWQEAKHLLTTGIGEIGCHTFQLHTPQSQGRNGVLRNPGEDFRAWEHVFRSDLYLAKKFMNENLNIIPDTFAYPYGLFSAESERILRESGYLATVTMEPGINTVTRGDAESLYLMMRIYADGANVSAAERIRAYEHIAAAPAITECKKEVTQKAYASREEAFTMLYSDYFDGKSADLSMLNLFTDTGYLSEKSAELIALGIANGKLGGFDDLTLRPDHYITRGEFAVMIARGTGYNGEMLTNSYSDTHDWNSSMISWCMEKGYMIGYGDRFGTNDFLTAEQLEIVCSRIKNSV